MTGPGRLAVLGAGHVGPVIARLAVKAGYPAVRRIAQGRAGQLMTNIELYGGQVIPRARELLG